MAGWLAGLRVENPNFPKKIGVFRWVLFSLWVAPLQFRPARLAPGTSLLESLACRLAAIFKVNIPTPRATQPREKISQRAAAIVKKDRALSSEYFRRSK